MFLVDDLDRYIYERDCGDLYGLGREFITRKHIKNRYGVNDKWIDTYAKDSEKVHVKLASGNIMTWATYHDRKVKEVMVGINYVDIEELIKGGNFIDITREFIRKKLKIDKEENAQRYKKGKFSILMMHKKCVDSRKKSPYQYHEVTDDDVTLALDTKINEPRLVMDEKKRLLKKIKQNEIDHDNKMRDILGLTPVKCSAVSNNDVVKSLASPQVFRCIYKRAMWTCTNDLTVDTRLTITFTTRTISSRRRIVRTGFPSVSRRCSLACSRWKRKHSLVPQIGSFTWTVLPAYLTFYGRTSWIGFPLMSAW